MLGRNEVEINAAVHMKQLRFMMTAKAFDV